MNEVTVLDLDWDLIQHLVDPASFQYLRSEQFHEDLIEDELATKVYRFQTAHVGRHGAIASASVIEDEFDEVAIDQPQAAIGDLLERLRKRYIRNQGQERIEKIVELTATDPTQVAKEMLSEGRHLYDLTQIRGESFGETDHELAMQDYDARVTRGRGPSFGFVELDEHFHGQSGLTFLVGAPKAYKSWFTINAVLSNIQYGGFPYLYSLELPATDSNWRLKCMKADVPYWKYLRSALELEERKLIEDTSKELASYGKYRIEKPNPGNRTAATLVERAVNVGATSLFIDQLQYVETRGGATLGARNDTGDYFEVLNDLRNYSDEIPIFIVHQFNRGIMGATEMPEPQQGKGSSAIEETATLELGLWANKDMRASNIIHLGTLVSRHYSQPTWEVGVELSKGCHLMMNGDAEA